MKIFLSICGLIGIISLSAEIHADTNSSEQKQDTEKEPKEEKIKNPFNIPLNPGESVVAKSTNQELSEIAQYMNNNTIASNDRSN